MFHTISTSAALAPSTGYFVDHVLTQPSSGYILMQDSYFSNYQQMCYLSSTYRIFCVLPFAMAILWSGADVFMQDSYFSNHQQMCCFSATYSVFCISHIRILSTTDVHFPQTKMVVWQILTFVLIDSGSQYDIQCWMLTQIECLSLLDGTQMLDPFYQCQSPKGPRRGAKQQAYELLFFCTAHIAGEQQQLQPIECSIVN